MMLPPAPLGGRDGLVVWRLDQRIYAATWDSGEGAFREGGHWNSEGVRAVYCSLDPATAILEVAVHAGFETLDITPHVITAARIVDIAEVHVVQRGEVPNPNWSVSGVVSAGQQAFGDALLRDHRFIAVPSAVFTHSWNLIFDPTKAAASTALSFKSRLRSTRDCIQRRAKRRWEACRRSGTFHLVRA